jgi:hypothetical protein
MMAKKFNGWSAPKGLSVVALSFVLILLALNASRASDVSEATLRRKLKDLRNDDIARNCAEASDFLAEHAGDRKVQEALLREFSVTDAQGREAILNLLYAAPGFQPDEHFIKIVLDRMRHYGMPDDRLSLNPAGNGGADFLIGQAKRLGDSIAAAIDTHFSGRDNSLWFQYAIARALAKGGVIEHYADRYTDEFFKNLAKNLKSDDVERNAELATMTFIFLGKIGAPTLQSTANTSDRQSRQIARLLLSYFSHEITIYQLCKRLGQSEFIGFDCYEDRSDLDDCDLTKNVVRIWEKDGPAEVVEKWHREAGQGPKD